MAPSLKDTSSTASSGSNHSNSGDATTQKTLNVNEHTVQEEEETHYLPFVLFSIMMLITIVVILLSGYILKVSVLHRVLTREYSQGELLNVGGATTTTTMLLPVHKKNQLVKRKDNKNNNKIGDRRIDLYVSNFPASVSNINVYTLNALPTQFVSLSWNYTVESSMARELQTGSVGRMVLNKNRFAIRNNTKLNVKYNVQQETENCSSCRVRLTATKFGANNGGQTGKDDDNEEDEEQSFGSSPSTDSSKALVLVSENLTPSQDGSLNFELYWSGEDDQSTERYFEFAVEYESYDPNSSRLNQLDMELHFEIPSLAIPTQYSKKYENVNSQTRIEYCKFMLIEYQFASDSKHIPSLEGKIKYMKLAAESRLGIVGAVCLVVACIVADMLVMIGYCCCCCWNRIGDNEEQDELPLFPAADSPQPDKSKDKPSEADSLLRSPKKHKNNKPTTEYYTCSINPDQVLLTKADKQV